MSNRLLVSFFVLFYCCFAWSTKRYCTPAGSLSNDGSTWAAGTSDIQKIINASSSGDTVWVAAGTYYPNRRADATGTITNNDRSNSFVLKSGVKVMGGFAGTETYFSQRNTSTNATILSGDLGASGNNSDNAYMIVIAAGSLGTAELNGFTITGGNATYYNPITVNSVSIEPSKGGGIACYSSSPILSNLTVSGCTAYYGGGICIYGSSPTMSNITITGNTSLTGAGMLITSSSSPQIENIKIYSNTATTDWGTGGGILSESSSTPVIKNALIYKNTTHGFGAGVYLNGGVMTLINSTVVYNTVSRGDNNGDGVGIKVASGTFYLHNSIVWGNVNNGITNNVTGSVNYSYCLLEAGTVSGTTIISNTNPRFVSNSADNYQLQSWSPALNVGNNSYNSTTTDLAGNTRTVNTTIDLGAYECQSVPTVLTKTRTIYVKKTATGTNDGSSWANAFTELSDALLESDNSGTVAQIWVAAGTYIPTKFMGNGSGSGDKSFVLQKDVAIYGGFSGSETALPQRNWVSNPTILSGNSTMYHVVVSAGDVGTAVLDGFSITGAASNNWNDITLNTYIVNQSKGGGIYCNASSPVFRNIKIYSNSNPQYGAAAYCSSSSSPTFINVLIYKNNASNGGGGIYSDSSNPTLINCTVVNNTGGGANGISGIAVVKNSIVWNNSTSGSITYYYSLVDGGSLSGTSIISNSNPTFVDNAADNYRLQVSSPAKNVGNNSYLTALSVTTDLDGMDRFSSTVDLGAYEYRGIIYVKKGSTGTNGLSWGDALGELSDAITKANTTNSSVAGTITDIWVAAGTYYPTAVPDYGGTRDQAFIMPANIKVYGGFVGTESNVTQRDYLTNETILSGDLGADSSTGNNAYHVVAYSGSVGTAELNGFTIKDGYADDGATKTFNGNSINRNTGAGIVCHTSSPSLQNLKISNCYTNDNGAGVFCYQSSPTINNCKIYSNQAQKEGGGVYITNSSAPLISNCTIYNNSILDDWKNGGGFKCAYSCNAQIINCLFYGNVARASGGAISNDGGTLTVVNSTIVYNNSTGTNGVGYGGGIFGDNTINIKNCIVWGNTVNGSVNNANGSGLIFTTSLVESKTASGIISNSDPLFTNAASNDYSLTRLSPAMNAGTNSANSLSTDLAGNTRILNQATGGIIDLGAYEYQTFVPVFSKGSNGVLYVKKGSNGGGSSWSDPLGEFSDALALADQLSASQIWVSAGTYYPNATNGSASRESSFTVLSNIKLYGGFTGTETLTTQRNIASHPSILSGDIGTSGDNSDNVYHVVVAAGSLGTACLDGFTVTGGNANGSSNTTINSVSIAQNTGGGIASYSSNLPLKNITVTANSASNGGGIFARNLNSVTFDSLTVNSNTASNSGGGLYYYSGTFTLQNSSFISNTAQTNGGGIHVYDWPYFTFKNLVVKSNIATSGKGGGIYMESANTNEYYNLLIAQNQAGTYGGGIYTERYPTYNCITVAHNQATTDGAGIYVQSGYNATLNNAIVWGNRKTNGTINNNIGTISYNYSLVQGAALNSTSIVKNINPIFLDSVGGDFRLKYISPAINQGNNSYASSLTYDLAGKTRVLNTTIDIGAYECYIPNTIYVKPNAKGGGETWLDAMGEVADAMQASISANAASAGTVSQIWVKAGTYYPLYKAGNGSSSRDQAFVLPANVKVYGGFSGTETLLSQRDWTTNSSILSGDIGTVGSNTDNAYHVVIYAGGVGTAELNGFTISGGHADGGSYITVNSSNTINQNNGGGINSANSSPILSNLILTNNNSSNKGGGSYFTGSSPVISSVTFSSNSSNEGGGMYNTNASPSISNSFFYSNSATNGAGIYNKTSSPSLTGDSIYNNTASTYGGGIYNISSSNPNISSTRIYSNTATNNFGGGIYNESSAPVLTNVYIYSNRAPSSSNGNGGGVANVSCTSSLQITNSFIYNNSANAGAGIFNTSSSPTLTGDSIYSNTAASQGGGIYNGSSSNPVLTNVSIYSNVVTANAGGGMYNSGSSPSMTGVRIHNNSATNASNGKGGGIYNGSSNPTIANSHIYANTSKLGAGIYNTASSPTLTGDSIYSNTASTYGGGIYNISSSNPNISSTRIYSNTVTNNFGGGMYNESSAPVLTNVRIYSNHAPSSSNGNGGGVANVSCTSSLQITNSFIYNNTANAGAGIFNTSSSPTLIGDSIYSNTATSQGGGIYNTSTSAPVLTNVNIYSNSATTNYGGGIYNTNSSPSISGAKIHHNSANDASNGNGGGIYNATSSPTINSSSIYANQATNGAGIYNSSSSPALTGDSIFSNIATSNGGGIHNASSSTATLTNVSIRSNTANSGGGVYNLSSSPVITDSKIYYNTAALGAGFYNFGSSPSAAPTLTNVLVSLNVSSNKGGGFYNVGSDATHRSELLLKDVLICGNTSIYEGGGVYNNNYTANTFTNVTLAGNTAGASYSGGGMYNNTPANCSETFKNSIIWGNKKGTSTVSNISNATVTYYYSLLEGGTLSSNSIVSNSDPLFVNPSIGNYRLQAVSPAKDAGNNTYISDVSSDLAGNIRLNYGTVDLGAYEFNQSNKWVGSVSTDPTNANNWSQSATLANNELLEFDGSAQRDMLLTADKTISSLYNHSSRVINTNGHKLTLTSNVDQSSTITASVAASTVEFAGAASQTINSGMFTSDSVCNLIVNNAANVVVSGNLHLANSITATAGKLDVFTNSASLYYSGQLLDNVFLNNKAYNLTLYNTSGYAPANDLVVSNNLVLGRNVVFTINPGVFLNVGGSITNNNGVSGLVLKASSASLPNGSLIFHNASNNPLSATVEMYSKAFRDPNGAVGFKYKWQFFGIPLRSVQASPTFDGSYLSEYNATSATSSWTSLSNSAVLTSFKGYEITQLAAKTITFQGILENSDMNISLAYNAGAVYPGQYIIANPYAAAISIPNIGFANCDATIYQYNTGSKADWSGYQGVTTASNPGQYIASTLYTAGVGGIPATIPSMQGFLVKANSGGGTISYSYNSLSAKNSDAQRSKSINSAEKVYAAISVASSQYADKMWLFSDNSCSNSYDVGWDAKKIRGISEAPQLFGVETDGEYQIDCKSSIVNTTIGFKAGADSVYSIKIKGENLSQAYATLYLVDAVANKVVSLQADSTIYQFAATPYTTSNRFSIVENVGITTGDLVPTANASQSNYYVYKGKLFVKNNDHVNCIRVYNANGILERNINLELNKDSIIDLKLQNGVYLLKASGGESKVVVVE